MKMKALSNYGNDKTTKYGDCILGYDDSQLLVYDCGHEKHAESVISFLEEHVGIKDVSIVISHNDSDHTDGILLLMEKLDDEDYSVTVYTSLYLKSINEIQKMLDDGRRTKNKTCEHILELFNHIAEIVTAAEGYGFAVENALPDTDVGLGVIVGPSEENFVEVVTKAIESDGTGTSGGETVMNAASIQLKCTLQDDEIVLLCGDASPDYIENLEDYDIIQLPHHGQSADAEKIFKALDDPYIKEYLISDNTGSGEKSGGSADLEKEMKKNGFSPAHNTQHGVVDLPKQTSIQTNRRTGVYLGCFGL